MIAYLRGTLLESDLETAIIDVQGIGYELTCSTNTLDDLITIDDQVHVRVYTHVREDVIQLFGFSQTIEKQLFLSLIKVNGIGPKMAVKILSAARTNDIVRMIENGDVKALTKLPKVGKKTAEQVILTLKGKLVMTEEEKVADSGFAAKEEIVSALVNLGFKNTDVEKVVDEMDITIDLQSGIRQGLTALTQL